MKYSKIISVIIIILMLPILTFADGTENDKVNAGTTPDSIFYPLDKIFEEIKLVLTFDSEKKAQVLLEIVNERMAEANILTEEGKEEYIEDVVKDYVERIEEAQEAISEIIMNEEVIDENANNLLQELEEVAKIDEVIEGNIDDELAEQVHEKTDEAFIVANIVKDLDKELVKELREKDLGYGQIAKIVQIAEHTEKDVKELVDKMENDKKNIKEVAKDLGISKEDLREITISRKLAKTQEKILEVVQSGDEEKIKEYEEKIEKMESTLEKVNNESWKRLAIKLNRYMDRNLDINEETLKNKRLETFNELFKHIEKSDEFTEYKERVSELKNLVISKLKNNENLEGEEFNSYKDIIEKIDSKLHISSKNYKTDIIEDNTGNEANKNDKNDENDVDTTEEENKENENSITEKIEKENSTSVTDKNDKEDDKDLKIIASYFEKYFDNDVDASKTIIKNNRIKALNMLREYIQKNDEFNDREKEQFKGLYEIAMRSIKAGKNINENYIKKYEHIMKKIDILFNTVTDYKKENNKKGNSNKNNYNNNNNNNIKRETYKLYDKLIQAIEVKLNSVNYKITQEEFNKLEKYIFDGLENFKKQVLKNNDSRDFNMIQEKLVARINEIRAKIKNNENEGTDDTDFNKDKELTEKTYVKVEQIITNIFKKFDSNYQDITIEQLKEVIESGIEELETFKNSELKGIETEAYKDCKRKIFSIYEELLNNIKVREDRNHEEIKHEDNEEIKHEDNEEIKHEDNEEEKHEDNEEEKHEDDENYSNSETNDDIKYKTIEIGENLLNTLTHYFNNSKTKAEFDNYSDNVLREFEEFKKYTLNGVETEEYKRMYSHLKEQILAFSNKKGELEQSKDNN